jgi:hypothetical protein
MYIGHDRVDESIRQTSQLYGQLMEILELSNRVHSANRCLCKNWSLSLLAFKDVAIWEWIDWREP